MSRFVAFFAFVVALFAARAAKAACTGDAVVLLLDRSGSMTGEPLEQTKVGAKRIVSKLGKDDCLEIIAFDSQPTRVVKAGPSIDRVAVEKAIDGITAGGGTEIFSALALARTDLVLEKSAKRKLVILLTDGQAPSNGIKDLAENMATENMRVSTMGLGSGIDERLLRMIADKTRGHMRKVVAPADLPRNLEEELAALRR